MSMHNPTPRLGPAHLVCWLLRASAPPRDPSAPIRVIRVIRGFLLCLIVAVTTPQPAPAQEDVAETKSTIKIDSTPITEPLLTDADRSHWSFAPIEPQPLPTVQNPTWLRSPVDSFILSKLDAKQLTPATEADRATLLRRLTFDLLGLPPTPAELANFENDKSPDAYERRIDVLLASPAFGERYGQYWLDLARFAESDGYEYDAVRPHAWKYRDWVIAAFNSDLPYDEFIRLQLAGDELQSRDQWSRSGEGDAPAEPALDVKAKTAKKPTAPPPTLAQIPTTFCLAGPDMPDVNDQAERRHNLLNELAGTVGSALLGLQMGCAQCHNHKYDPISQADFYRLRAVFEPAIPALKRDLPNNILINQNDPLPARLYIRGDYKRPGLEVPPAFPRIADREAGVSPAQHHSSRSDLAQWLISPSNPLTSRVIANRLWQYHFGRGICTTPSDFGLMGGAVTHPELLDYLAVELRETGWSMKRLHRLIAGSAAYRQSSTPYSVLSTRYPVSAFPSAPASPSPTATPEPRTLNPEPSSADPENALYWTFPRQRLTGEAIRDAMLSAAGLLTTERGGRGVMPPLPEELLSTLLKSQWSASKREADHYKRSVYVFARRNLRLPLFEAFDRPDANASCPLRTRSTTAPQSLLLFNSELSLLVAQHLAGRVLSTDQPPIESLYLLALSRRPSPAESQALQQFLTQQQARLAEEKRPASELALPIPATSSDPYSAAALVDASLALLNSNEFIYID